MGLLGAAGAAVAISITAERYSLKRQTVALGTAAGAFAASLAAEGPLRALLQGAALAGLGVAIVDLVRSFLQGTASAASSDDTTVRLERPDPQTDAGAQQPASAERVVDTRDDRGSAVVDANLVPPEHVEHLSRVYRGLDEDERQTLSAMNATGPIERVTARRAELLRRSPRDAVAFLRRFVLGAERGRS